MVISIRRMDVSVYRHAENTMGTGLTALFLTLYSKLDLTQVGIGAMMLMLVSETRQMVRAQKPRVCTCKFDSDWVQSFLRTSALWAGNGHFFHNDIANHHCQK